jgi:hypothetical protein
MRIAVVHQLPVEYYPPVSNFVDYVSNLAGTEVHLYSSPNKKGRPEYRPARANVWRNKSNHNKNAVKSILDRLIWHFNVARQLSTIQPENLIYFEPHSAFAAYLYYRIYQGRAKLFIHHHEYYSAKDYLRSNNKSIRIFHRLEICDLFKRAKWISQTNRKRLELFEADHPSVDSTKFRVLSNLPPAKWKETKNLAWLSNAVNGTLKLVYVGSVSLADTYLREVVEWVCQQNKDVVSLDIFAYQLDTATSNFLKENESSNLRFHSTGVSYDDLPQILSIFHVGLILYKGNTVNFQHNATNKLFEYLACGLDVWFASNLQGVRPYQTESTYPRVIPVDFTRLSERNLVSLKSREHLMCKPWQGSCEDEYQALINAMQD